MTRNTDILDAIVIGAGPAGLTAAVYLGRFRRRCVVLEDGQSRARWIPTSHNIPGFAAGIGGNEFLHTLREQAITYGAEIRRAHASRLAVHDGIFSVSTPTETLHSRNVLLATGVRDHLPDLPGVSEAVMHSLLRFCPICDAFEAIGKRIAVLGNGPLGAREAAFLKTYSERVTLLQIGSPTGHAAEPAPTIDGIERVPIDLRDLHLEEDRVTLRPPVNREFDVLYLALGCSPQHDLARSVAASCDDQGALQVNAHQETSVPGLYAAGDLVRGLNQVVVAAAESAIAATDIHNKLRAANAGH